MRSIAIVQSNYIPWKGYFDLIASVDEFILFDDMQYTRRDWRNRNKIKTPQGLQWLTIPVSVKGKYEQRIRDTQIDDPEWGAKHWNRIAQNYCKAPHFERIAAWLEPIFLSLGETPALSAVNRRLIEAICSDLGITTRLSNSWDYAASDGKSERLANLTAQAGGAIYVSGPAAKGYLDESVFSKKGIAVEWFDYAGYPEYPQLWEGFEHGVSIIDLLFNCGPDARKFMERNAS